MPQIIREISINVTQQFIIVMPNIGISLITELPETVSWEIILD